MSKSVIVLGGGGHAKVLIDSLLLAGKTISGFSDLHEHELNVAGSGIPYIGDDDRVLKSFGPSDVVLVNGIGSTGDNAIRKNLFNKFKAAGFKFATVCHPSTVIAKDVILKEGVQIMAGVVINPGCLISENTIINTSASIDHDCQIGAHVHVAPGVTLSGCVQIGDDSHIGTGASVVQGVEIESMSMIKAGSVVTRKSLVSFKKETL